MSQVYVGNGSGGSGPANDLHVSKWIVNQTPNAGGNQTTLAAAMAAASAGDTIFLYPGTYNENVTWTGGVAIVAFCGTEFGNTVNINGTITINAPGFYQTSGIRYNANGSISINFTGSASGQLFCTDCYFVVQNGGTGISYTSTSPTNLVQLYQCSGNILDTFCIIRKYGYRRDRNLWMSNSKWFIIAKHGIGRLILRFWFRIRDCDIQFRNGRNSML